MAVHGSLDPSLAKRCGSSAIVFVLLIAGIFVVSSGFPAKALTCNQDTTESVIGRDAGNVGGTYGSMGDVTIPSLGSYYHGSVRSVIVERNSGVDFAEAGWSHGPDFTPSASEFFANVYVNGQLVGSVYNGVSLSANTLYTFKIHDAANDGYWHGAVFDSSGTRLDSTTLTQVSWTHGTADANTEIHSECDPRDAHWLNLQDCTTACTWVGWNNDRCSMDTIPDRDFDRLASDEHKVDHQTPDQTC